MTYTDTGVRGATGQSWRGANPRELLKRVIDDHPGADRTALFRLFIEKLKEDDDGEYMETIIEYWFSNNYHSLVTYNAELKEEEAARRAELKTQTKNKIIEKITEKVEIILSDMIMPNGKRLADCTGAECRLFGTRIGGWLRRVAAKLEPDQTVGAALNDDDLKALYQKHA